MFRNRQFFYIFVANAVYGNDYIFNSSKNQGLVHAFLTFLWIGSIYGISPRCDFHFNCFVVNATWAMYIEISRILIYLLTFRSLLNPHITNKKFKIWGTKVITFISFQQWMNVTNVHVRFSGLYRKFDYIDTRWVKYWCFCNFFSFLFFFFWWFCCTIKWYPDVAQDPEIFLFSGGVEGDQCHEMV